MLIVEKGGAQSRLTQWKSDCFLRTEHCKHICTHGLSQPSPAPPLTRGAPGESAQTWVFAPAGYWLGISTQMSHLQAVAATVMYQQEGSYNSCYLKLGLFQNERFLFSLNLPSGFMFIASKYSFKDGYCKVILAFSLPLVYFCKFFMMSFCISMDRILFRSQYYTWKMGHILCHCIAADNPV